MERGTMKVCGSEYSPSENAFIYAQILDATGDPANTATVTLNLYKSDGTKLVNAQAMTYITGSNGLYQYNFTAPADVQRMIADVASTSPVAYGVEAVCVAEWADQVDKIKKIESGRWKILSNQLLVYDEDDTTVLYTFDLLDSSGNASSTEIYERRAA